MDEHGRARLYGVFGVQDPISLCRRAIAVGVIKVDGAGGTTK